MPSRHESDVADDLVRRYLDEIGSYQLLTPQEEVALAEAMEAGRVARSELAVNPPSDPARCQELEAVVAEGHEARQRFIEANLRLVVSIARRYPVTGLTLLDLIQEGNLGLMRAVEKFDPRKGFKFSTYATWWVRQGIGRALADKSRTIRVPVHMVEAAGQVTKATVRLTRTLGRNPTPEELARETGFDRDKVVQAQRVIPDPISLFEPVGDDDAELVDFIEDRDAQAPFDVAATALERDQLRAVLRSLSEREQRVLELRFGLVGDRSHTLEEVGRRLAVSSERVRQIEAKALCKLRHPCTPALPGRFALN